MNNSWYDEAEKFLDKSKQFSVAGDSTESGVSMINRMQLKRHRGKRLTKKDREEIKELSSHSDSFNVCCRILLKQYEDAVEILQTANETGDWNDRRWEPAEFIEQFLGWPIARLLSEECRNRVRELVS